MRFYLRQFTSTQITIRGIILGLFLFAFTLRLHQLNSVPVSLDEILTIKRYVPLAVADIFKTHHSNNQPMVSMLAHLFSPQANQLFLMRWPMVLVGMLALPFLYRLSCNILGRKVGVLAVFLLTISPIHIAYSMVVRGYGGLILLTIVSLYLVARALRCNRWRDWLGFVSVNLLIIYFHMFGVLAVAMQIGLVGLWLGWELSRRGPVSLLSLWEQLKPTLIKYGTALLLLLTVYPFLIFAQTTSVLSEGGHPGEFEVWRNDLSWPQSIGPFMALLNLMAPMSPGGIGAYIYLFWGAVGLVYLWHRQELLAIGAVIWIFSPFVAIFVAMHIFGVAFYTYARFLLYLLPSFLILVATGIITSFNWLLMLTKRYSYQFQIGVHIANWAFVAGLLGLAVISINWYTIRSSHADWSGVASVLLRKLPPQDITICEQYQRGFAKPDRAKPYCIWMLEFFVPELQGYTPRFQSTTDFIANYNHLQQQRAAMLQPGGVWLVIWQKVEFNPGHLITNEQPTVTPPSPLSAFAPYQAWQFGSTTLVHIASADTLFGNIYKTLELMLQIQPSPSDKARYYRSLAEMEAVQGHKDKAEAFLEKSWLWLNRQVGSTPIYFWLIHNWR